MKNRRNGRYGWIGIAAGLCLITGCAAENTPIEYVSEESDDTQNVIEDGEQLLLENGEQSWNESIPVTRQDGTSTTIRILAKTEVPDTSAMYVCTIQEPDLDSESYKEQFLRNLFGDGVIYDYRDEYLPQQQVAELLELHTTWEQIKAYWYQDEDMLQEWQKEYDQMIAMQELLKNASEQPRIAEDFSGYRFMGNYQGIDLIVDMEESQDTEGKITKEIDIYPNTMTDVCQEVLKDYLPLEITGAQEYGIRENQCQMSRADALQLAEEFLEQIGITEYVQTGVYYGNAAEEPGEMVWAGAYHLEGDDAVPEIIITDGYVFYFVSGIENVRFKDSGQVMNVETQSGYYSENNSYVIYVNDYGVIRAELTNPVFNISEQKCQKLIGMETIEAIIRDEITSNPEQLEEQVGDFDNLQMYTNMDLCYFRVKDKEHTGYYSYIPVWRLYHTGGNNPDKGVLYDSVNGNFMDHVIMYNAMDGTLMNLEDSI